MKFNKILIILLAIFAVSAFASAQETSIQQLKQSAENSANNLTAYTYSRTGESNLVYKNSSLNKEYDVYKTTNGKVDLVNQKGWWGSNLSDEETREVLTWEGYFINGSEYWKQDMNWTRLVVNDTAQVLQAYNEIPGQVNLIKYSNMKLVSMEKMQGEDYYKIMGSPIQSIYSGMTGLQLLAAYFPSPFALPVELRNGTFDISNTSLMDNSQITLTAWISRNDSTLGRLDIDSALIITPEILNISSPDDFRVTSYINESTVYSKFGSPVEIALPKDAQNASTPRMIGADWRWALFGSIRP